MIIGMDFGTTNTGAATYDGVQVRLLPLDAVGATPEVCRSAIYMTRTGDYFLGSAALKTYYDQNIGRPTRFRKVWVGQIIQIFAELPVFYRDVFVYEDEYSPGRLFTSIKTALRNRDYFGTTFRGNWYSPSDLVAIYLMGMKLQMEQQLARPVKEIVLGRPVHFSNDPAEDRIAQGRLLDAAFKAGFERVYLELEPVAAALAYERQLARRQMILVFDFGGGTLDFTVMEVGGRGARRVLATGGVPIAGDVFDQRLFRVAIPPHLGEGEEYLSGKVRRPIPAHIFDTLAQPAEILSLNTPRNLEMLRQIHAGSLDPHKTHALLKVVSANYALMMFDLVERAKRQLSVEYTTSLVVKTPDFSFRELLTRPAFERAIANEVAAIQAELLATLARAGLKPVEIDRVIRTGGSSQIPLFVNLLGDLFGYEKVHAIDIFSSVASGLAIRGQQIASGSSELPGYTPESLDRSSEKAQTEQEHEQVGQEKTSPVEKRALPVDLAVALRRLQVRQEARLEPEVLPRAVLFLFNKTGIYASALPESDFTPRLHGTSDLSQFFNPLPGLPPGSLLSRADLEQYLLLATNQFKLISIPVRDLYLAQQSDPEGVVHSLPLDDGEAVSACLPWTPQNPARPLVCMLTAAGQGRAFDAMLLADTIARRPFFQLERRYNGSPLRLFPADPGSLVVIGTDQGRLARAAIADLVVQPYNLLRLRSHEHLSAAAVLPPDASGLALSDQGMCLRFEPLGLPDGGPPAQRGAYLRRNFNIAGLLLEGDAATTLALSNQGRLHALHIPAELPKSSGRAVQLASGELLISTMLDRD